MKAFVFAAGLGTRLKPYTDTMPKALVPYAGRPMLWHLVRKLKAAGVDELVINVHHFAGQIVGYVHQENDFGMKVSISDATDALLDTGGGLLHARPFLEGDCRLSAGEPFLAHNVDILSNLDINAFVQSGVQGIAKLLVSDRESSRKLLFDNDMRLVGWKNLSSGQTKGHPEKASCEFAFAGVHLISPSIYGAFDAMKDEGFTGKFSIVDFYLAACDRFPVSGYLQDGLEVLDLGKPEALEAAARTAALQ